MGADDAGCSGGRAANRHADQVKQAQLCPQLYLLWQGGVPKVMDKAKWRGWGFHHLILNPLTRK
jgi:hypothetical protein